MTRRALILFAALGVAWGIPYLFIKIAVTELDPAMVVLSRAALAAILLLPLAFARREVLAVLRALEAPARVHGGRDHRAVVLPEFSGAEAAELDRRAAARGGAAGRAC